MYATCGDLQKAQALLDVHKNSNVIPWNALIVGYGRKGQGRNAINCFKKMLSLGISPDKITYSCILKACALIGAIDKGEKIHVEILSLGLLERSLILGNCLVDMYAKCGALCKAQQVLGELRSRNTVSWSALITGYAHKGQGHQALKCFEQMQHERIVPDAVTYVCVLKACATVHAIEKGKQIHEEISRHGLLDDEIVLGGALIDMYSQCGALSQAHSVLEKLPFRNLVCWNSLIAGYAQEGQGRQALVCFKQMQHEGVHPNVITYVCILKACGAVKSIEMGKQVHDKILRQGLLEHDIVLSGALIDMYAQCGALSQARSVLERLPSRNVVCWNALITGYTGIEQGQQVLDCLEQMQHEKIAPDKITYLGALKACGLIEAIEKGKEIHNEISRQGLLKQDILLSGALVDMYVQCGALSQAQIVLEELPSSNIVCWNSLIAGYARIGKGQQALGCLEKMQGQAIVPDIVTFVSLLTLCAHLGLVEKGQELFGSMEALYGLKPDIECFTCMVDLLGQTGHLLRAVEVVETMTCPANSALWHSLLCTCRKWLDVDVGLWAFLQALELEKCDGAAYALMSSLYAAAGMPEKVKDIETMRLKNKAWKQLRCCLWTDTNNTELLLILVPNIHSNKNWI